MTRKSRALYDAVMERIIDVFDEVHPDRFIGVDLVMSDYESAIQGSLTAAFHGSEAVGCFFHYSQALWRRVQKYGLQIAYKNRPVIRKYVKEIIALALLPANQILAGYQDIKAYYADRIRRETRAIQEGIKKFNTYFLSYWIGEVSPEVFSVFGLIHRTNNLVESWHSWLSKLMGGSHLNVWDFLSRTKSQAKILLTFATPLGCF